MLKFPCLVASQCQCEKQRVGGGVAERDFCTHIGTIWRRTIVLVILSDFVKIIFVQLPDETRKVAVLEMFREDQLGEFFVLLVASVSCGNRGDQV
jgi:hypothetical protein